jgi:hypothetical protein
MLGVAGSFSIILPEPPASSHCSPAWRGEIMEVRSVGWPGQ